MKRAALCVLGLLAVVLAAGCGGARSSAPPAPLRGSLVVEIRFGGGPVVESRRLGGGKVVIFNTHRRVVGVLHVKPGHSGRIRLRPGHYSLGLRHWPLQGCGQKIATVRAGRITRYPLSFGCSIP